MSPTERSLKHWRGLGYLVDVVERWIPRARIRRDLFGIIDLVAIGCGETVGIQCTSRGNVSARVRKIADAEALPILRECGWRVVVQGWDKKGGLREVDCS